MIDKIKNRYLDNYYGRAEELSTWFSAGLMNFRIAEFLLKKYNSHNKRERLQIEELVQLGCETKKRRLNCWSPRLHKYILMFFGLSLECYIKGLLIKTKKLIPLSSDKKCLSDDCIKHLSVKMFNDVFSVSTLDEINTINRLRRAILAGKYPIEKEIKKIDSYTGYFDLDIISVKQMIKRAKQKWQELRFSKQY